MDEMETLLRVLGTNAWIQAGLLAILFLFLAKLADRLLARLIAPLLSRLDLDPRWAAMFQRPVFTTVAIIGLVLATYRLDLGVEFETLTLALVKTILIVVWLSLALRLVRLVFTTLAGRPAPVAMLQPQTVPLLTNVTSVVLVLAAIYAVLVSWNINVTGLVASAGIAGLALSFAAQDTLANLVAGVAILTDRPYRIGDYIVLDTGERGQVTQIGLRSTRLLTRDDVEISIPNGIMGRAKIVNESGGPSERYRIRVPISVAYGSDIDRVMTVLLEVANGHEQVCRSPESRIRFREFGDSGLNFELLSWISQPAQRGLVQHELNCAIYRAFAAAGISIPFPQRDLHLRSGWPDGAGLTAAGIPENSSVGGATPQ
jgi:small-conductance mechanosensitive channel